MLLNPKRRVNNVAWISLLARNDSGELLIRVFKQLLQFPFRRFRFEITSSYRCIFIKYLPEKLTFRTWRYLFVFFSPHFNNENKRNLRYADWNGAGWRFENACVLPTYSSVYNTLRRRRPVRASRTRVVYVF